MENLPASEMEEKHQQQQQQTPGKFILRLFRGSVFERWNLKSAGVKKSAALSPDAHGVMTIFRHSKGEREREAECKLKHALQNDFSKALLSTTQSREQKCNTLSSFTRLHLFVSCRFFLPVNGSLHLQYRAGCDLEFYQSPILIIDFSTQSMTFFYFSIA